MTFPTAAAMTTRRSSLMERLGAVIAPPGEPVGKVGPHSLCRNGDLGQHDRARLATNAAYRNAPSGGAPALPSLHDRQAVGYGTREHVRVQQHDHSDDRAERDRVPEHVPEDRAFVPHLIRRG